MVETTGGEISFMDNSARLSKLGVSYEDKTAEAIAGTVKLLGEVAGTVIGAIVKMSADGSEETRTKRELIEGAVARLDANIILTEEIQPDTKQVLAITLKTDAVADKLLNLTNEKLTADANKKITATDFKIPVIQVICVASSHFRRTTSQDVISTAPEELKLGKGKVRYLPGVVYRTPAPAVIQLVLDTIPMAEVRERLPEAGQAAWLELTSKIFSKVSPGIDFGPDGGIKQFRFTSSSKVDEVLKILEQSNTSSAALLDQLKKADTDKRLTRRRKNQIRKRKPRTARIAILRRNS